MKRISVAYGSELNGGQRQVDFVLRIGPWWALIVEDGAYWFCDLTRNRLCHRICNPALAFAERHTREVRVPSTSERVELMCLLAGWDEPYWVDDDEDDSPRA